MSLLAEVVRARIISKSKTLKRPITPGGAAIQYYGVSIKRVMKGMDITKVRHIYAHADCGVNLEVGAAYMLEVEEMFYGFLHTPCGIAEFWNNTKWLRDHIKRHKNDPRINCK
ncbi:unnamed protein product [Cylicocyclus nassatus]|uniref:Uncharacterized protein n=1 Tax=Cylicocyclus nassatus TaxID=53992 RepID=A0AA36GXC8_CYLNA|nr:unnamed protein product [Cylicocyclus nassatus]